ncbi:uncharacterized protein LOC128197896 [Vigna angularis]|uniref:uncharacterized protein LOC128197896 n=1 Tax=Phaseolus angularis TaxID=3914 RepID=UPI0022B43B81|nr:uncharacterized protein LOC128197896 [Vigna angularis]
MTRGNSGFIPPFDPEIDRTFHRLIRHSRNSSLESVFEPVPLDIVHPTVEYLLHTASTASVASVLDSDSDSVVFHTENNMAQPPPRERTFREMAAPDFDIESLCIQYPDEDVPFVLKTGLIHLLPKFHGLAGESPHKHLKEFHIVCSSMKPHDVPEEHIFLKAFPHSLENVAKDWLYGLAPRSVTSWDDLKRLFLDKFFPASRTTAIRKDITGIRQLAGENLYEYWERFKTLCASCPHHQIPEQLLIQYFYEGLNNMDRGMIDAASGGALGDTTPANARQLIEKMASNSQQFSTRNDAIVVRGVHDVVSQSLSTVESKLENQINSLAKLVTQLTANQRSAAPSASVARLCAICPSNDHYTDACPSLQHPAASDAPQAYATNIFNNRQPQQQNHDLSTNRYNPGWRNHPNLRWNNAPQHQHQAPPFQNAGAPNRYVPPPMQQYQRQQQQQQQQQQETPAQPTALPTAQPSTSSEPSLEELVRQMTMQNLQFQKDNMQFQQETRASIQNLTNQMGQMATQINQAQSQNSDKLPSQTVQNPRNVSAITLRSGKQIVVPSEPASTPTHAPMPATSPREDDHDGPRRTFEVGGSSSLVGGSSSSGGSSPFSTTTAAAPSPLIDRPIPLPFPSRALPSKKMEEVDKEILETFRKVEVNIPLLDAIKQIPKYAKFLKDLCTHKRKMKGNERISMGRNVSALIGKSVPHIPEKCKDPGIFCIPCVIGNNKFENAMLDLGASVNVMPLSIYESLSLGPLQTTGVVIQLANRSVTHPTGFIEDVLVRVGELIFPADFYVLEMEEGFSHGSAPIILGRPFLKTARTKIDVYAGTLSMEFADIVVHFNIFDAMKFPAEDHSLFRIDTLEDIIDEFVVDNFNSVHEKKHSFLSSLHSFIESGFTSGFDNDVDNVVDFDEDCDV